jgi:hypothetical protein
VGVLRVSPVEHEDLAGLHSSTEKPILLGLKVYINMGQEGDSDLVGRYSQISEIIIHSFKGGKPFAAENFVKGVYSPCFRGS